MACRVTNTCRNDPAKTQPRKEVTMIDLGKVSELTKGTTDPGGPDNLIFQPKVD